MLLGQKWEINNVVATFVMGCYSMHFTECLVYIIYGILVRTETVV